MENINVLNHSFTDFEDLSAFFDHKYFDMLENANKLDEVFWDIEKEGMGTKLVLSLEELINLMYSELKKIFGAEEYIYREMKNLLPDQSSVAALKSENSSIMELLDIIKSIISNKEELKKQKDTLQAELVSVAQLLERNVHKKENILFHEARTLIPKNRLPLIVKELSSRYMMA